VSCLGQLGSHLDRQAGRKSWARQWEGGEGVRDRIRSRIISILDRELNRRPVAFNSLIVGFVDHLKPYGSANGFARNDLPCLIRDAVPKKLTGSDGVCYDSRQMGDFRAATVTWLQSGRVREARNEAMAVLWRFPRGSSSSGFLWTYGRHSSWLSRDQGDRRSHGWYSFRKSCRPGLSRPNESPGNDLNV
jgi:hypothetical protein